MRRLILCALLCGCIPEPVRAPPCEQWARRCTPTGQSALCVAGEWVPDNTTNALRCER